MSSAQALYKEIISNRKALTCTWKEMHGDAVEYALVNMKHNGSKCSIGNGYHVFMFDDGSALKMDENGIEIRG